jgi:spermidine/putrescine transport system permease protein
MKPSRIPLLTTLLVLVFFYFPILVLTLQSFNASKFGGSWEGFSLVWYRELMMRDDIHRAAWNTLLVALASTGLSVVLGTLAAWCLHRYHGRLQQAHYALVYAPLVMPDILMGISLLILFVNLGMQLSLFTVILAHTTFCLSYVAFVVFARLQDFDDGLIEAAQDLGAAWPTILWRIWLPLVGPGILAGGLLAFTLSVDDFVITFLVSGPGDTTLPVKIFSMMRRGSPAVINALSVIFMAVTFAIVILSQRLIRKKP